MTRLLAIAAAVLVVGAGADYYLNQSSSDAPVNTAGVVDPNIDTSLVTEMSLGNPDAPVTIIEYASYTCPHCRTFHEGVFNDLKADFIDTGEVHFIYREVYFDRPGLWAGLVARCGGPDRFFGLVNEIYRQQGDWARGESAADIAASLRRIGLTAGISPDALDACFADEAKAEAMLAIFEANAELHGIDSTPSFVINGTTYQNMAYDRFRELIAEAAGS